MVGLLSFRIEVPRRFKSRFGCLEGSAGASGKSSLSMAFASSKLSTSEINVRGLALPK
jgi:hypothetical protein